MAQRRSFSAATPVVHMEQCGILGTGLTSLARHVQVHSDEVLGSGTFGIVYAGTDRQGRRVAVKALDKYSHSFDPALAFNEVQTLQRLQNLPAVGEQIADLIAVHEDKRYIYLISTLYEGGELFDRILENALNISVLIHNRTSKKG